MTTLGKNELRLLREAVASRAGLVVTSVGGGRGELGGKVRFGGRDRKAAVKLRARGLLAFEKHEKDVWVRRGNTVHVTDSYWKVTDAGRAALAEFDAATPPPA